MPSLRAGDLADIVFILSGTPPLFLDALQIFRFCDIAIHIAAAYTDIIIQRGAVLEINRYRVAGACLRRNISARMHRRPATFGTDSIAHNAPSKTEHLSLLWGKTEQDLRAKLNTEAQAQRKDESEKVKAETQWAISGQSFLLQASG